jgi:hypothetical protein
MLEGERLLSVRREEYVIDGKTLRAFYWQYRDLDLNRFRKDDEEENIYEGLPDEIWRKARQ